MHKGALVYARITNRSIQYGPLKTLVNSIVCVRGCLPHTHG